MADDHPPGDGDGDGRGRGARDGGPDLTPPSGLAGWRSNWWGTYGSLGFEALVGKVKGQLNSSGGTDNPESLELPRLSIYNDTVLGPPMTRSEEIELKQHLEHILRQVQYSVKLMGLEPVELLDVEIAHSSQSRHDAATAVRPTFHRRSALYDAWGSRNLPMSSSRGLMSLAMSSPRGPGKLPISGSRNLEAELEKMEIQNAELIAAYDKFSAQYKLFVAAALDTKHITPEFAHELDCIVECYNKNVKRALKSGGYLLTLKCLLGRIDMVDSVGSFFDNVKMCGSLALFVVTVIDGAMQTIGTSPIQFKSIGKKAKRILGRDFTFDKLRLNCDPYEKVSFGAGMQFGGTQTIREVMLKCKDKNNSFAINLNSISQNNAANGGNAPAVPNNDIATTRISLDKICGADMRCVLKIPFPSLNSKFEVRYAMPYVSCAGGVEWLRNPGGPVPVLDFSAVGGFKYVGCGAHFQLRGGVRSTTLGLSLTTDLLNVGLTYKSPSNYNATIWKRIVDSSTSIAAQASYRPQPAENAGPPADGVNPGFSFTVGVKHALDPTFYGKARVGTDGASIMVKKSSSDGMVSIKGAVHVDFEHPRRVPKMGVVCSFRC